jgi:hypothetical protein
MTGERLSATKSSQALPLLLHPYEMTGFQRKIAIQPAIKQAAVWQRG